MPSRFPLAVVAVPVAPLLFFGAVVAYDRGLSPGLMAFGVALALAAGALALLTARHVARADGRTAADAARASEALARRARHAEDELARHAERLRIVREIDRALIAEQAPEAIVGAVVRPLRELIGVPRVIVNVFDLDRGEVEWLGAAGRHRVHVGPGVRYSLSLAGDLAALRRGEPQTMDVHALPPGPEPEALLASGVHVYVVVPMIAGGELIGSVSLGAASGPFPAEQIGIAQEVAAQLAIALRQARQNERIQRQNEELEHRVRLRTVELSEINERLEREVAERRRAETQADEANTAKSEFLSRMSHELRTPLNGILGFAQLLQRAPLSDDDRESAQLIERGGRHLLRLINEVLDIARIEAGRLTISLEPVEVAEVVHAVVDLVRPQARTRGVHLSIRIPPGQYVTADRQRLQQVLLNLLSNGVKYNRDQGSVAVSFTEGPDGYSRIAVTDTGPGIPPAMMERLFVPFERLGADETNVEGTGLGLALSKRLVEAMGGTLLVESKVGAGSTFTVHLAATTVAPAAVAGQDDDGAAGPAPDVRGTVLYIEDNVANLRLIERILRLRPGLTLISAMQGSRGLDLARTHVPGLILLDLHLPDLPGDEVLTLLQADPRTREIPVVILSADATPNRIERLRARGVHDYLVKPLDVSLLLALLDRVFGGPRVSAP